MNKAKDAISIDPTKYVVLDVETNGLSSVRDDLLSISIYKPDTGESYNRFLPLELNTSVVTTEINGIKTEDLNGFLPLTQAEVDEIIKVFELRERICVICMVLIMFRVSTLVVTIAFWNGNSLRG